MNIYTWIFAGLLGVDLILYIIGQVQRIRALEKVARGLLVPFLAAIIHSILAVYLPDSYHIMFISSFAFFAAIIFMLCTLGDKNRFVKLTEEFFYVIAQCTWLLLIVSVYRIFKVPQWLFIISGAVYFAGFIVICIFIKKQTPVKYAAAITQYLFTAVFGTTALISLVYEKRVFGILIFCGALVNICHVIFEIFQRTRPFAISEKTEKIVITILTTGAQALLGAGAILMQV